MFLDEATIHVASGKGGAGSASFHREKHVPRGGPNGADGGRGGDIVFVADHNKRTLYDFKLQPSFVAKNGSEAHGNKAGKNAEDVVIRVPVGTVLRDVESGKVIADLCVDEMRCVVCRGGRGGKGNLHYTNSVRQAPKFAELGAPGEERELTLELKLLADVGLIGLPNAGKSTLISQVSASKAKIGDYPFTTLIPNLGVVSVGDDSFTVADMPGLIEGAHAGHGLGHQFLRHVERTAVLVHVVDCAPIDESDPIENYRIIEEELRLFDEAVFQKSRLIALNKIDVLSPDSVEELRQKFSELEHEFFPISAATGAGVEPLLFRLLDYVREEAMRPQPTIITLQPETDDDDRAWEIVRSGDAFEVVGKKVERMVAMTDLENEDAVRYLHRRLMKMGVIEKLRNLGAEEGDTVYVGKAVFAFLD